MNTEQLLAWAYTCACATDDLTRRDKVVCLARSLSLEQPKVYSDVNRELVENMLGKNVKTPKWITDVAWMYWGLEVGTDWRLATDALPIK